jgi:hypothetical protein
MEREGGTTRDGEIKEKLSDFCPKPRGWVQFFKSNTFYTWHIPCRSCNERPELLKLGSSNFFEIAVDSDPYLGRNG